MATTDRDPLYTNDGVNRTVYTRESNSTGWFVGIIVALALLAIAYLVFSANSNPSTTVDVTTPPVTDTTTTPMAPVDTTTTPMAPAETAPAPAETAPATPVETAPADTITPVEPAPATSAPATAP
jgi:cytoskeletal protein RodZ